MPEEPVWKGCHMELSRAREEIIEAGLELVEKGLVARTWGNISARISDEEFAITPSGKGYDSIRPEDIVPVRTDNLSFIGDIRPSSEAGVHAAIYRLHPEINFVIHTHQSYATALSILGENITAVPEEKAQMLGSVVPCAAYGINGTKTLATNVAAAEQAFLGAHAILMKSHGAICFGRDQDSAFRSAFALEDLARSRFADITGNTAPAIYTPDQAAACGLISYHTGKNGTNVFVKTPVMKLASEAGRDIEIFIDDAAQLFGSKLRCLPENADQKLIFTELKRVPAVLIRNKGAVCLGDSRSEAEAAFMVAEKNCLAALLSHAANKGDPLSVLLQVYEHTRYVRSYAKLKNA